MVKNTRFPPLNPLRFVPANEVLPAKYNSYAFDKGLFWQQIRKYYQKDTNYIRKVQRVDPFSVFMDSLAPAVAAYIYNDKGELIIGPASSLYLHQISGNKDTTFNHQYYSFYAEQDISSVPDGVYYEVIECIYGAGVDDPENTLYISEPFWVRESWPKTTLLEYTHDENDYDVFFETFRTQPSPTLLGLHPVNFAFRCEMEVSDPDPAAHDTVFEDQNYAIALLDSSPDRVYVLTVAGVPAWVIDRINRILSCRSVMHDGTYYTKNDNAKWSIDKPAPGYRLRSGTIELREANPGKGWEYPNPAPEGGDEGVYEHPIYDDIHA